MSKENDNISETSTQDQDKLFSTKNVINLNDNMRVGSNKQPKVIFEKPGKLHKVKSLTNDYVFSLGTVNDKMKKYTSHKKKLSLDSNDKLNQCDNRLEKICDESNISINRSNNSSKLLYVKDEKKTEKNQKLVKSLKKIVYDPKAEKKEKIKNLQKKKEISEKIKKSVLENNYIKAEAQKTKNSRGHNKRSKSSDLKSMSSIKRTNMEEDNEELMYNLRSTSSDKIDRHLIKLDPNSIKIKDDNKKSSSPKKSKRDRTKEYNKKQMQENKEKFKKHSSNKNSYPKETSKDSEYEDRPKRTPMNHFITSEKNQISNISDKNLQNNNPPQAKSNNFFFKESKKEKQKKTKPERIYDINQNRLKLIESNNVLAIIEAEKKNEKEKNKELGKIQHKISYLTKYNRIDVLSQALANQLEEGEGNEVIMENIDQLSGEENEEYGNEQFEMESKNESINLKEQPEVLNDSIDQEEVGNNVVKNPIEASNQTNYFKSLKNTSLRSKSTPSIKIRKPKVDTFDFLRKITGNNNFGIKSEESNTFRRSFSNSKKNNSKSVKSNSQDQLNEVKVDYKTTHFVDNNNFVLSYKERRSEEQSQQLQRIIQYQKEKRKVEKERQKEEEEEKSKKILANLIKLNIDTKSKSMSRLTNKTGINSSSNIIQGKNGKKYVRNRTSPKTTTNNNNNEDSSYLDNDVYLQHIREFINNDLPKEKQFVPDYMRKKGSAKNLLGNKMTNNDKPSSKNTSIDNFDKSDIKANNNNFHHNLKSITEISEKNPKLTENTPKNYIISPKDNFQGFDFTNHGVNSIKTPNSEEIDKKMNFFESGDFNKQKIQTLKSLESEFLSINDKNFNEFSNNFNKDFRQVDEKARLTELKQKWNSYKEKFKNIENVDNNANENNHKSSNRSNDSCNQNNIEKEKKSSKEVKKKSENSSISFKNKNNQPVESIALNKVKKAKEEEVKVNQRIQEITMHNAAIKLQNLFRYIKYYREHYDEFQEGNNEENRDHYMESEPKIVTEGSSGIGYKLSDPNEQYSVSDNKQISEENIDKSIVSSRQISSDRNQYNQRINNSYEGKGNRNVLDESDRKPKPTVKDRSNLIEEKQISNRSKKSEKSLPYDLSNRNVNEEDIDEQISRSKHLDDKSNDSRDQKSISYRKGNENSHQGTPIKNSFNNQPSPMEKSSRHNDSAGMSVNNSSFRSDNTRKCYSVQQNRNNSTIILSPNSVDSPRLHNIIALKDLIQRQRMEMSMSQDGSEQQQNYSQKSRDYIEDNQEKNEINNTSEYKNNSKNDMSMNNDSMVDISIHSNKSAGNKLTLKTKPGAPKLNLLDLGKKNKSRSDKSESSEQLNISGNSGERNFDIIESTMKKNTDNYNNIFKNKAKSKEVHSNNNLLVGSRDGIDLIKNKNHLISSQDSIRSIKGGMGGDNNNLNDSRASQQNALLSSRELKINDDDDESLSSSKVSVKIFHNKKEAKAEEVIIIASNVSGTVSENSNRNNSLTFKSDFIKRPFEEADKHSLTSQESLGKQSNNKQNEENLNPFKKANLEVKEGIRLDESKPIKEKNKSSNTTQSYNKGINYTDSNPTELQKSNNSNKQMTVQELSSHRQKQDSSRSEMNSELDIEADKDGFNTHIDWQMSLLTEKTIDRENNNALSNRSDRNNFFFNTKTEERPDEDYKDNLVKQTKEIKDNQSANNNNSYNDFIDDENLGNIEDNDDNSNFDDILKDKGDEDAKNLITSLDNRYDKISEIASQRDNMFKKNDSSENIKISNLLDDIRSNSELITLSPHLVDKEKLQIPNNARYQDYVESERKSCDKVTLDHDEKKEVLVLPTKEELKIVEEITDLLLKSILKPELEGLVPKKRSGLKNSINVSMNNSHLSSPGESKSSMFMKSVIEENKEIKNNFYINQLGPHIIKTVLAEEISSNYNKITNNLSKPYRNKPVDVLVSLLFRDKDKIKSSYKINPEPLSTVFNKRGITNKMDIEVKKQRNNDKDLIPYDKILNECLLDAAIENLNEERVYGECGEPFAWSNRTRMIKYKYADTEGCKNSLIRKMEKNLNDLMKTKIGLIPENNEVESELINYEREKRLVNSISKTLNDEEELWKNYELEETQVKLELSEMVLEQLLNELVEIFEHVHLSRKHPKLYQFKSIYGCEDIPRLSFQYGNTNEGDDINQ